MTGEASLGATFSAGAEQFDRWTGLLWAPMGEETVGAARPAPGQRVLDACCGAGASALPAARAVGSAGAVDAVDLAPGLLAIGRERAAREGLPWLRFAEADVTAWDTGGYDVVQCVYGVFFLPDLDTGTAHLASLTAPGGKLVITTWAVDGMGPISRLVADTVNEVAPENPAVRSGARDVWQRINSPERLAGWLNGLGLSDVDVREVPFSVPMDADLAWSLALGTGMRRMLAGLGDALLAEVRERFGAALGGNGIDTFNGDSLIAVGVRH
jgi:ubiquinone/menaquinone biosynthesis C-methylase UbiE